MSEEELKDRVTYLLGKASVHLPESVDRELWEAWMIYSRNIKPYYVVGKDDDQ